jgi:hypothetical protein
MLQTKMSLISSADKESVAELENRILLVKQRRAPQAYETLRQEALEKAEVDRLLDKSTPDYLEGVDPPWNDGRKEVEDLYDDMMVEEFEQRIAAIHTSSDSRQSSEESGKAEKAKGGPGGSRPSLSTTSEKPTVSRPLTFSKHQIKTFKPFTPSFKIIIAISYISIKFITVISYI